MNATNNYGSTFKELREKRGLSLTQVARGIISPATLSRWENGKGEMYFDNVVSLLQHLNIYLDKFVSITQYDREDNVAIRVILKQVQKAYIEDDSTQLKLLSKEQMERYRSTNKYTDFFLAITLFNCYKDITGINFLSDCEVERLGHIFQHVKIWNKLYTRAFGNSVTLLNNKQLFEISVQILDGLKEIPQDNLTQISESVKAVMQ